MSDRMIDPNMPMTVTLPAWQMNSLMALGNEALASLGAILQDVQRQCLAQSMHAQPRQAMNPYPMQMGEQQAVNRPNGEAAAMEE